MKITVRCYISFHNSPNTINEESKVPCNQNSNINTHSPSCAASTNNEYKFPDYKQISFLLPVLLVGTRQMWEAAMNLVH